MFCSLGNPKKLVLPPSFLFSPNWFVNINKVVSCSLTLGGFFFILGKLLGFPPQPLSHSSPLQSYTPACSHKDSKSILYLSLFCLLFLSQQPCLPLRRIVDLWRKISINYYQICKRVWSCLWERGLLQTFHAERWSMMGSMQGLNGSCMK